MGTSFQQLRKMLNIACPEAGKQYKLEFKNCFGAVAGYADGNIFCARGKFGFALKLPGEKINLLIKKGAKPLRYFPNGHVKKEYAVLPEEILHDKKQLKELVVASIRFVTD
ncbi:hypothetical protein MNBD_NITROSPINAE03-2008 [hydrothermal vent metagenome]|uniref:TfoX N-terminal domain-containing protein n=1 Tax=hydrothermal vent metagenome TaxID=652676 RepID=A0A3B1BYR1_9ZZZZ